jgi:DNA-binding transcriptional LysR family regulator
MRRRLRPGEYAEARAFVAVAEARSFRAAAQELGLSASSISHAVRAFERRIGHRLLNRTTRSVTVTEAGLRLLQDLAPALELMDGAVAAAVAPHDMPFGAVSLAAPRLAIQRIVTPAVSRLAIEFPHVTLDVRTVEQPGDLAGGFDLGIGLGGDIAQDMVAIDLTGPFTTAIVGSPAYFAINAPPQHPRDLSRHRSINCRSGPGGTLYRWEFERGAESIALDLDCALVTDDPDLMLHAALEGVGLWHGVDYMAQPLIDNGRLLRVLVDWSPVYAGFHLYYAAGAPLSPAVRAVVDVLRRARAAAAT